MVIATGVMSQTGITEGKGQYEQVEEKTIQVLSADADKHGINCDNGERTLVGAAASVLK